MVPTKPLAGTTIVYTLLALLAFAGNSLLCRLALRETDLDAASFTLIRLVSGAAMLLLLVRLRQLRQLQKAAPAGSWPGALALFIYAIAFSYAYLQLDAGLGALFLFGAVQLSMTGWGLFRGERLTAWQWLGLAMAVGGLVALLWPNTPGANAEVSLNTGSALLMLVAGVAWGAYSLIGRHSRDALASTTGNFVRTLPLALLLLPVLWFTNSGLPDAASAGVGYAIASGAITSGIGYALWYKALPALTATQAATVQLSVPVVTAFGGVLLLAEVLTPKLVVIAAVSLTGIGIMMFARQRPKIIQNK